MRHVITLFVLAPATIAVTSVLCALDIAQCFADLAASDRAGSWS